MPTPRDQLQALRAQGLSASEARRLALSAQGLAGNRPSAAADQATIKRWIDRLGLLQLDSVSVLVRAHYLPLFSRLGPYDRAILDRLAAHEGQAPPAKQRRLFEYWAHEASLLPVALQPLLRWRMARAERGEGVWGRIKETAQARPDLVARLMDEIGARGPMGVSAVEQDATRSGAWWGWSEAKNALEWLFWTGRLTTAGRKGFERLYDLPERVLPPAVLAAPTPDEAEAQRQLLMLSARALGVATAADLRDYFRLPAAGIAERLAELVETGELLPAKVEGWRQPAYLAMRTTLPRHATHRALLAPFDPMIWDRGRTERLFDFVYRLEIYTPADRRQHGYYVLPFLMGERMVARVDLKTDRPRERLLVRGAHLAPGEPAGFVAQALHNELRLMADWLKLERVEVEPKGDLAKLLREVGPPATRSARSASR